MTIDLGDSASADHLAVQPDGRIVIFNNGAPLQFAPVPSGLFVFGGGMVLLPNGGIVLGTTVQTGTVPPTSSCLA